MDASALFLFYLGVIAVVLGVVLGRPFNNTSRLSVGKGAASSTSLSSRQMVEAPSALPWQKIFDWQQANHVDFAIPRDLRTPNLSNQVWVHHSRDLVSAVQSTPSVGLWAGCILVTLDVPSAKEERVLDELGYNVLHAWPTQRVYVYDACEVPE